MVGGEGMMAVVRALPDATLAMSVLDGNGQYMVMPKNNTVAAPGVQRATYVPVVSVHSVGTGPCTDSKMHGAVNSHSAQVVDGRYASVYQMAHCNVHPTSPPLQLTEFPPQRAEVNRGQGNFEVGGIGSGETSASPTRASQSYRGAMNWPDRSVYTPRQSFHYEPDSFADSLRKYPNMSVEQSTEIVERLINYTQMKSSFSKQSSRLTSPTRSEAIHGMERRSCIAAPMRTSRLNEPDVSVKPRLPDESPTRDSSRKVEYEAADLKRGLFGRNYDVRYLREITRRAKESVKSISTYPYSHPICPPIKERYDHLPPKSNLLNEINSINSVHMETQAEIPMSSKEVTTLPREQPPTRNVAVPLSPTSSNSDSTKLPDFLKGPPSSTHFTESELKVKLSHKSIQTTIPTDLSVKPRKSVQTCISSIDIAKKKKVKNCRRTKSQEEIRLKDDLEEELLQMIKDLSLNSDVNANFCVRNGLLRKLRKIYRTERSDRLKIKLGRCVRDQLYSHIDFKQFTRDLSDELISKIQASNMFLRCNGSTKVLRANAVTARDNSDNNVIALIKVWLEDIPVKQVDYLGRPVNKENVLHSVASKIECLVMNKIHYDRFGSLKRELFDILEDIPIDVNPRHKDCFLNRIASELIRKIKDVFTINAPDRKKWQTAIDLDKTLRNNLKKKPFAYTYILPTDNELQEFVKQELKDFSTKFHVTICPSTEKEIQIELIDILIDSLNTLRYGDDETIKEEILIMLSDYINISENESIYFVNNLIYNYKDMLKELHNDDTIPKTFVVLQNTLQNCSNQTVDQTFEGIVDKGVNSNLTAYTQQIDEQVNEWMENIRGLSNVDAEIKKAVAQDLAADIVDRHKYLELNPSNKISEVDKLEHLKYQIFKWINKLVGENNFETIEKAPQLMQRIQNIQIPMLLRPAVTVLNVDTGTPSCCKKKLESNPSEQRRASSPSKISCPKPDMEYDNRRQSSPYAISYGERNKCCSAEVDTKNLGVMTEPVENQIRTENSCCPVPPASPPLRKTTYTETDMPQIPSTRPQGTSMSMSECPRTVSSANRRFSGPPEISSYVNTRPAEYDAVATSRRGSQQQNNSRPLNTVKPTPLCCVVEPKDPSSTIKQLNAEYDQYLQNWVLQIPIITSNPEEQKLIDTMRKGIYNGVWKARTKLQMNPNAMENQFYYQDIFDDELEELLDLLPQSPELTNNKQMLKNQLIEKTVAMNNHIYNSSAAPSYKQQLIDNVSSRIPRKTLGITGSDIAKICEDIHKLDLAETFIVYTMYRNRDNVKANVYRKKLMKQVQEFFDNLKTTHGMDVHEIDFKIYRDKIMEALHTVPQPSDETIREEGGEVLIGFEIEQWFSDLPLYPAENNFETLCRKRYRDTLAKIVHDLEKQKNLADCEDELRHEIRRFVGKLPLRQEEIENMPFIVEELVNRFKNRPKDVVEGSEKRRLMPLIDPLDYDEFSRDMPLCSSFSDAPGTKKAQVNESSYYVRDGERIETSCCPWAQFDNMKQRGNYPNSNQEWLPMPGNAPPPQWSNREPPGSQNKTWLTLNDTTPQQPNQPCQPPHFSQQRQSLHNDGAPQARQMCQRPDSKQWQTLHDDDAPPRRQTGQGLHTSAQNSPDCCQLQNIQDGSERNQSKPRDYSYREAESRLQETHFSGTCTGPTTAPDPKSPEPALQSSPDASRQQETRLSGAGAGQVAFTDQRREQSLNTSRLQELQTLGNQSIPRDYSYREPQPLLQETHFSGTCAGQASAPDHRSPVFENFQGNASRNGFQENLPPGGFLGNCSNVCPSAQESRRGSMANNPDRSQAISQRPEASDGPYTGLHPNAPQGEYSSRQSPSRFSGQPVGSSTPQQSGPAPRVSRPKKRTRQVDRSRRDAARKKLEMTDSDESDSEEVKCRCMERIWKCKAKRPTYTPCEECDLDFPPCFPMRFPYPYYF